MTESRPEEYDVEVMIGPWWLRRKKQKRRRSPNAGGRSGTVLWPLVVLVVAVLIICVVEPGALDVIRAIISLMASAP